MCRRCDHEVAPAPRENLVALKSEPASTSGVLDRTQLNYLGTFDEIPPKGDDLENLYHCHVGFGVVLKDFSERERQIMAGPFLNKEGKEDAVQKAVPEFGQRLAHLAPVVEAHEAKVAALEQEVSGATLFKVDDAAGAVRAAEIRTWFSKIDRAEQIAMLHEAVRSDGPDDRELIAAICGAPGAMKIIPAEIRKALIDATAEKRWPAKIAELARRRKAVAVARFGLDRAREVLRGKLPQSVRNRLVVGDGSK